MEDVKSIRGVPLGPLPPACWEILARGRRRRTGRLREAERYFRQFRDPQVRVSLPRLAFMEKAA